MHDSAELSKERWRDVKEGEREKEMGKLRKRVSQGEKEGRKVGQGAPSSLHKEPHCETPLTLSSLPASISSSLTYSSHSPALQLPSCFYPLFHHYSKMRTLLVCV